MMEQFGAVIKITYQLFIALNKKTVTFTLHTPESSADTVYNPCIGTLPYHTVLAVHEVACKGQAGESGDRSVQGEAEAQSPQTSGS